MTGDEREMLIQLIVGVVCAVLVLVLGLRVRGIRRAVVVVGAVVVLGAILVLGMLEARVIAAVIAGSALGTLLAGVLVVVRDARAGGRPGVRRILILVGIIAVGAVPLLAIEVQFMGESVMRLTRAAAETSDGSWLIAFRRTWELVFDPIRSSTRIPLAVGWTLLLEIAALLVAIVVGLVIRWRVTGSTAPRYARTGSTEIIDHEPTPQADAQA